MRRSFASVLRCFAQQLNTSVSCDSEWCNLCRTRWFGKLVRIFMGRPVNRENVFLRLSARCLWIANTTHDAEGGGGFCWSWHCLDFVFPWGNSPLSGQSVIFDEIAGIILIENTLIISALVSRHTRSSHDSKRSVDNDEIVVTPKMLEWRPLRLINISIYLWWRWIRLSRTRFRNYNPFLSVWRGSTSTTNDNPTNSEVDFLSLDGAVRFWNWGLLWKTPAQSVSNSDWMISSTKT
jgi:hypothetical protein